jgi:hypothetical protein
VARALEIAHSIVPGLYERFAPSAFTAGNFGEGPADPTPGNTLEPRGAYRVDGGWRKTHRRELADALLAAAGGAARGLVRGR